MPVPPATTITGTAGDDELFGTVGNDVIDGLEGNDQINGGEGSDWVTYQGSLSAVEVFVGPTGFGFASGGYGEDNLTGIENAVGSNFDDFISASSSNPAGIDNIFNGLGGNDNLLGGQGNDTLYGGDGHDQLFGQQGDDVLDGENGNDFMRGGSGNDMLIGGSGFDRVSFFPTGSDPVTGGVTVSLLLQGVAQDSGQGMDILIGVEALSGTPFNDSLTGDGNVNWLVAADFDGAGGDDQLYGLGGNDLLEVAAGNHILDGGADNDTLSFNALGFGLLNGVSVSLALQGAAQVTGLGSMTISNVENLSGTSLDDALAGDASDNVLSGAGGNDVLSGGSGNDTLYGDAIVSAYNPVDGNPSGPALYADVSLFGQVAGNDVFDGGAGDDILNGGAGTDTASFGSWTGRVFASLNPVGNGFATNEEGTETDSLISIENLTGSAFNDSLNGNDGNNVLNGGAGNDLLFGRGGDDVMIGGEGNDFLRGSDGADTLDGGNGNDNLYGDGRLHVDTGTGGSGPITLFGDVDAAFPPGGVGVDGNDVLGGGKGDDSLYGGRGDDVLTGDQGADLFAISAQSGDDRITDFKNADTILFDAASGVDSFSDLTLTQVGSDTLITWGTTDSLLIEGLRPNRIDASDFSFEWALAAARVASMAADCRQGFGWFVPDHGIEMG